jgi:DNA-binding transcriptional LysR family regulator
MPRMQAFRALYPEINIQIVATQNPLAQLTDEEDVTVFFGTRADAGDDGVLLLSEKVIPVCAPGFLDQVPSPHGAENLSRSKLIHLDSTSSSWFDWTAYFTRLGYRRAADNVQGDISFNTYSLVIQAAIGEQGVALGWTGLVDDIISNGALVAVGTTVEAPDRGYWLLATSGGGAASKLVNWLLAQ